MDGVEGDVGNAGGGWRGPVVSACRGEGTRMVDQHDFGVRRARRTGLTKEHGGGADRPWSVDFGNHVDRTDLLPWRSWVGWTGSALDRAEEEI
jgi:hypothetical protein